MSKPVERVNTRSQSDLTGVSLFVLVQEKEAEIAARRGIPSATQFDLLSFED